MNKIQQIQNKYTQQERHSKKNANKFIMVPEKPMKRCTGFTYCGAILCNIKETQDIQHFKNTKGQLISKGLFDVIVLTIKPTNFF